LDVVQPAMPRLFNAVDPDAEAPDPAPELPSKHSLNPGLTAEPSEDQDISSPAFTTMFDGPDVPEYSVPPMVNLSNLLSVLNTVDDNFAPAATLTTLIVQAWSLP
jgi:hypothetical protein